MLEHLNGQSRLFPIIGDPIEYVKSPERLTRTLVARGHNAMCIPMRVTERDLDAVMHGLARMGNVDGLLVTMPHKFTAFAYCATGTQTAQLFGGVSVIRRNANGTWHGDMLDGLAFVKAQKDQGAKPLGAKALLVGAGAAGSAIAVALLEAGVGELIVYDKEQTRTAKLLHALSGIGHGRVKAGPPDPSGLNMVCNATPLGMTEGDPLPIAAHLLKAPMFVGDVIAGHGVTPLLKAAQAAGCKTANGDQMVQAVQEMMVEFLLGK